MHPPLPRCQAAFLAKLLRTAIEQQPEMADLRQTLIKLGGLELVVPPGEYDPTIPDLLTKGRVIEGPIVTVPMLPSASQMNIVTLWLDRYPQMTNVCSGYALSADGLWCQHAWGLIGYDKILESTITPRELYFGITYSKEDSERVALGAALFATSS